MRGQLNAEFNVPMNFWRAVVATLILATTLPLARAQSDAAHDELETLVHTFLAGASRGDRATHERFWSEDLVYTSSAGFRTDKATIIRDLPAQPIDDPDTVYTAEDIRIRIWGDTAVVTFRLVATPRDATGAETDTEDYLNTGVFRREPDGWRAVAWQATRIPPA